MTNSLLISAFIAVFILVTSTFASAATIPYGVYDKEDGKNNSDTISYITGDEVIELAKIDDWEDDISSLTVNGLTLTGTVAKDGESDEYIAGTWSYTGTEQIDWLVIKYGRNFGIYQITDGDTSGTWDISELEGFRDDDASGVRINKDGSLNFSSISHASAYTSTAVIPVPAAAWLFSSGFIGLLTISRYRNQSADK